jgi:hypothetical protein
MPSSVTTSLATSLSVLLLTGAAVVLTPAPATALAAQRFASPTGTTADTCATPAEACRIDKAINGATAGDEVVLAPGSYTAPVQLTNTEAITIRGASGSTRPVINAATGNGLFLSSDGVVVRDLEIVHTGSNVGLLVFGTGVVERVSVHSSGSSACAASYDALVRDSLCVATGIGSAAIEASVGTAGAPSYAPRLLNVTAVATGAGGTGIDITMDGPSITYNLDMRNVIAQGAVDISRQAVSGASVVVTAASSNYAMVTQSGGGSLTAPGSGDNQTEEPQFVDTTRYRQKPASPTVDAGTVGPGLGTTDLDGDPRAVGSAPDIGSDELPDTTAPDTRIAKHPKKRTFSKRAKFRFSSPDSTTTFRCRLDKKAVKPCTSPFKKKKLKYGKHVFRVWAVDAYGNVDPTPAKYRWKVKRRG